MGFGPARGRGIAVATAAAARAVAREAAFACRPRAHVALVRSLGPILRVRRCGVLPCRRRAARDRGPQAGGIRTAWRALYATLSQDRSLDEGTAGRHLGSAVYLALPGAVPVQRLCA